jgi:hypothetical protein
VPASVFGGSDVPQPIEAPAETETAIELPYRLVISPSADATWRHRRAPFTVRGRTELWHTRLVLIGGADGGELSELQKAPLRAIWSPDFRPSTSGGWVPDLGLTAMTGDDRRQIVILTSAFNGWASSASAGFWTKPFRPPEQTYVPQPFQAELLMMSALGGWLRTRGDWIPPHAEQPRASGPSLHEILSVLRVELSPPPPHGNTERVHDLELAAGARSTANPEQLDLSEWVHVAAQGRDHYVRIVYDGRLLPFGQPASLVKVTERKFEEVDGGWVGAYLMQHVHRRAPARSGVRP